LTSRLYQTLVVAQKLAVNVGAYSDSSRLDNGEFMIYAVPAPQVEFAELARAIDDEITTMQTAEVGADILRRAKRQLVSDLVFARDSQQSMANIFGSAAMIGLSPDDVLAWVDEIDAVTANDVRRAAQAFLKTRHSVTGHLTGEMETGGQP
jgi:zinc protease